LTDKLKDEWPGILAWMIEGALEWQTEGLTAPQAVRDATGAYLEAEDALAAWIDDKCKRDPAAWEQSTSLFASWASWAEKAGEHPGTMRRFAQTLESRGFLAQRKMHGRGFLGLQIVPETKPEAWYDRDA